MDIQRSGDISNFETLVKNVPNNEISSAIQLLKNKISNDISGISTEIINLHSSLHAFTVNEISDVDLLYLYCTVKQLSTKLHDTKNDLSQKLKKIKNEYVCSTCKKSVKIYYNQGLVVNLQNHICIPCDNSSTNDDFKNKILLLREYELYRQIHYDKLIKEQLFFKLMTNGDKDIYFYTIHIVGETFLCIICDCEFSLKNSKQNILQHITGQRHIAFINELYSVIFNFHSHFAKLEPKYQLLQTRFKIVDDNRTKCRTCNVQLNFKNLSKHVALPIHTSSTVAVRPSEFVKYDEKILNTIYKDLLDWCMVIDNEKFPIFQNIDRKIYCIACNVIVHTRIPNHISSDPHKENLSRDIILSTITKYHRVWSIQPVHIQIEQIYFKRRDNRITCTLCSDFFAYNTLQLHDHVESIDHKRSLMRYVANLPNPTPADSKVQPDTSIHKNNERIFSSSNNTSRSPSSNCSTSSSPKNVPGVFKTPPISNSPILKTKESASPKKPPPSTIDSSVNSDFSPKKIPCLMDAPISMKFSPKKLPGLMDSAINMTFSPKKQPSLMDAPIDNTDSPKILPSLINSSINSNISQTVKMVSYDKSIFDDLYSDGLIHFTVTIDFTKYPSIVKRGDNKFCFTCNIDVTSSALLHANSLQHFESIKNENRQNCLKKFHDLWLSLPYTDQCRQYLFNAMDDLKCTVCNSTLNYDVRQLTSHLESWEHVQKQMSGYSNIDVSRNDEDHVFETHSDIVDKIVKGVEDRLEVRVEKLIDIDENSETDTSKSGTFNQTSDLLKTEDIFKSPKGKVIFKPDFIAYPKEILDELYGNELVNYTIWKGNTKYPFVQSVGSYNRCLLCSIDIIGSVLLHINSAKHGVFPKKFLQLQQYHDLWVKLPVSDQLEQKFFDVGDALTCNLCDKEFKYDIDNVISHIYSLKHQNESWSLKKADLVAEAAVAESAIDGLKDLDLEEENENDPEKMQNISQTTTEDVSINLNSTIDTSMKSDNTSKVKSPKTSKNQNDDWEYSYQYSQELNCVKYYISSMPETKKIPRFLKSSKTKKKPNKQLKTLNSTHTVANLNRNVNESFIHNEYFLQETNCVKYYFFSMMPDSWTTNNTYHTCVLNSIYLNLQQYVVRYNSQRYMCLQNRSGEIFCLLCRTYNYDIEHVDSVDHTNNRNLTENLLIVQNYHKIFSSLDLYHQLQQTLYYLKYDCMVCVMCGDAISYTIDDVKNHNNTVKHRQYYDHITDPTKIDDSIDASSESESEMDTTIEVAEDDPKVNFVDEFIFKRNSIPPGKTSKYFCLICDRPVSNYNHIYNHIYVTSRKHINRSSNIKHRQLMKINKFLSLWNNIDEKFSHMKGDFMIVADNIILCMDCGVNIEYHKLEEHLVRFHQGDIYPIKDKLNEHFEAPPTPYLQEIGSQIFQYNIPQLNVIADSVSYPIIQTTTDGIFCILCKSPVAIDLMEHLDSPGHILLSGRHTSRRKVCKYHGVWSLLDTKFQKQMIYFNNQSSCSYYCILCNENLGRNKLKTHLYTQAHMNLKEPLGNVYENETIPLVENATANISKGVYCADELYPRLTNDYVRRENKIDIDIIQISCFNNFACLICQIQTDDVFKHISTIQHTAKVTNGLVNVMLYHKEWAKLAPELRYLQNVFYPISPTITFCSFCSFNVEYVNLERHLEKCHFGQNLAFEDKLDDDFNFPSRKEYFPKVLNTLYKDNIPQCNMIIDMISYPVIQTIENNIRCLLCYKGMTESVHAHLNSEDHALNVLQIVLRNRLRNYHDAWLDGDEDFQMQQAYFERDGDMYYCKICRKDLRIVQLREHIVINNHNNRMQEVLIKEIVSENSTQDAEMTSQNNSEKVNMDSSLYSDESGSESEDDSEEYYSTSYDTTVIDAYYPTLDKDKCHIILDNIMYPIFRQTVVGVKCMLCKRNPDVIAIENHLILGSHINKMTDRTSQNKLKRFHDFWMQSNTSIQLQQKYFHRMKCLACEVQVEYESISAHIMTVEHGVNISKFISRDGDNNGHSSSSEPNKDILNDSLTDNAKVAGKIVSKSKISSKAVAGKKKSDDHVIKKSVQHPQSNSILDKIPSRYDDHRHLLMMDNMNNIFCTCCSKKLKHELTSIKGHVDSPSHLKKSKVPKKKMKYYCEICVKRYSMESSWDNHLVDLTHIARFHSLGKSRRDAMTEHECRTCDTVIFGDEISLRRHRSVFGKNKPKEITLPRAVLQLFPNLTLTMSFIDTLLRAANKASENQDKEKQCCVALVRVLKDTYPQCKAYPFGSRVTGLGYIDSDLDIFIDIGDMYSGDQKQEQSDQANIVNTVAKTLQKYKIAFSDINKVAGARTPIVQVYHKESKVDCDISFRHGLSVENTAFIRLCLDLQPVLRPTILLLKEWYVASNLSGLSSYALTMLAIFYMQTNGYLLHVKQLRLINPEACQLIDGWETVRYTASLATMKQYINKCEYTVIELMEHMFEYYAKFDFDKWVICPLLGMLIPKKDFNENGISLPLEMGRYVRKLYGPSAEYFKNTSTICIQDPFDLSHNLTKACNKDFLKKFQIYCHLMKTHLSALPPSS